MKLIMRCTVALAAGFLLSLAPAPARCENQVVEHTIRSGDNLHLIAGYYYGNPREWQRVWKSNRKELAGPNRLLPGRMLRIEGSANDSLLGSYDDFRTRVRGQ
ncbi:MAG: LysM peptidoglycan-binding domain-containing protein [Candidatus Methylomirabilia bacterium]